MLNIKERVAATIQNPEADTKILFNDAADGLLKTKDSSGVVEELSVGLTGVPTGGATGEVLAKASATDGDVEWIDPTGGVKEYVALLTQTGINAPVATVLKNTLGGTVVWTRSGAGIYLATLASAFVLNKTTPIDIAVRAGYDAFNGITGVYSNTNEYILNTFLNTDLTALDDGVLTNILIKIEVYP